MKNVHFRGSMFRVYGILAEAGVLGTCARFVQRNPEHRMFMRAPIYVGTAQGGEPELRMTSKQRTALRLRAAGRPVSHIARIMGISERATYSLLARATESARRLRNAAMEFLEV